MADDAGIKAKDYATKEFDANYALNNAVKAKARAACSTHHCAQLHSHHGQHGSC